MTTDSKMSEAQLKAALRTYIGTESWYRHPLFGAYTYTDGVRFLAMEAGAYWLIDLIFSLQYAEKKVKEEGFQFWTLTVHGDQTATLQCTDGNYTPVHTEEIPFTDFPIKECTLYLTDHVLLLPSEY